MKPTLLQEKLAVAMWDFSWLNLPVIERAIQSTLR